MQTCQNQQTLRVCCSWFLHVKSTHRNKFAYLVIYYLWYWVRQCDGLSWKYLYSNGTWNMKYSFSKYQVQCQVKMLNGMFSVSSHNSVENDVFVSWFCLVCLFLSNPFVFTNPCNELTWLFLLRYLNTIHDNFPNQTSYDIDFDSLIYSRNFP